MWNINNDSYFKTDNRGMSLVELLVSLAVLSIVLAMLAAIMMNVLNVSVRTNSNVALQNESQTTMNLVVDSIMGARGLIYNEEEAKDPGRELAFLYLGDLTWDGVSGNDAVYTGDVIVYQKANGTDDYKYGELYLLSFDSSDDPDHGKRVVSTTGFSDLVTKEEHFKTIVNTLTSDIEAAFPSDKAARKQYLMGKYVTKFEVGVIDYDKWKGDPELAVEGVNPKNPLVVDGEVVNNTITYYYCGPVVLSLDMDFEMEYRPSQTLNRPMDDSVTIRNRLPYIFLKPYSGTDEYGMIYLK